MSVKPVSNPTNVITTPSFKNPIQWLQSNETSLLAKISAIVVACMVVLGLGNHAGYFGLSIIVSCVITVVLSSYAFGTEKKVTAESNHPQIVSDDWGKIVVKTKEGEKTYRDVVITPTKVENWNWNWNKKEPMHHNPGIRTTDLDHYLLSSPEIPQVVILSEGRGHGGAKENPGPGVLQVDPELKKHLFKNGVQEVHILKTALAIFKYREYSKEQRVAALIHTTC